MFRHARGLAVKKVISTLGAVGISVAIVGCGGDAATENSQTISISGSTSVTELMEVLGETFARTNPESWLKFRAPALLPVSGQLMMVPVKSECLPAVLPTMS